ncbi:MAG TPA: hypothetical protein VFV63_19325 [Ilumatobacteraceae bacterium]|nr:hypothetical protein [Ilumatobacteraceae bacterium]
MVLRREAVRSMGLRSLLIITLLVGAGCGSNTGYDDDDDAAASQTADPTVTTSREQSEVPAALRFRAPLVGGGEIDMSTLAGKPVVMWFWAPY